MVLHRPGVGSVWSACSCFSYPSASVLVSAVQEGASTSSRVPGFSQWFSFLSSCLLFFLCWEGSQEGPVSLSWWCRVPVIIFVTAVVPFRQAGHLLEAGIYHALLIMYRLYLGASQKSVWRESIHKFLSWSTTYQLCDLGQVIQLFSWQFTNP